ncbi:hypothetical protein R6V09_22110 [Streptomyces sp. W16]|uniref:hypothetical protein n=1 Tax=Streptomyces sp. W16 TaxID=3076631 RepID=UPI00295ABDA2|nr:hypothetical protein [Streptomyces sp. W16]MDV9172795.1 hypothetical protein [Streptomyces sp. W16]
MNWKKRGFAATALGAAVVLGSASAAFAEGPHYPQTSGRVAGGTHNQCTYNWIQADTTNFPGYHGKHVFLSGIAYYSAGGGSDPRCHPHVEITYKNNAGAASHTWGKKQSNGSFEAAVAAKSYKSVYYTEMWVANNSGKTIKGTYIMVNPKGKVLAKG